jgi:hypothetical protein
VNVFCAISKKKVYGPIFFAEHTVTGMIYLDMLENWLMPQLNEDSNYYLFQQDGCPAHYHKDVRGYLNKILPQRLIGRTGQEDHALMRWPPRSAGLNRSLNFLSDVEIMAGGETHYLVTQTACNI